MSGRVGVHDEDAARFFDRPGENYGAQSDCAERSRFKVGHAQVQMQLLRDPIGPVGRLEIRDELERQLGRMIEDDLTPGGVGRNSTPSQQVCIEDRQADRIRAVEHH